MRMGMAVATAILTLPGLAGAIDLRPEVSGRGWFFSADGHIENTDLDALDFDEAKGQPEVRGGLTLNGRHRFGVSYLRVRREERGIARAVVLGILPLEDEVSIDLSVDDVRGHYGYRVFANRVASVEPFLEVSYLREETDIANATTGQSDHQEDATVFPLPGVEVVLAPSFPLRLRARVAGIGTGQGHLIDVEGGAEARVGFVFGGLGYRYVDFLVEDGDAEVADVTLTGLYLEGGLRF